jgi:antitoxin component YwqK of YwqJK toxin-antitoxin module
MENFSVTWEVKYHDHQPEIVYCTEELIESKNLASLKKYLDENAMDHSPEMDVPYEEGDFNIEWVLIHDQNGKQLYRDEDFEGEVITNNDIEDTSSPISSADLPEGMVIEHYENGQKESEGSYKAGNKDGVHTVWYPNGQIEEKGSYKVGNQEGSHTSWHENGQKYTEYYFKEDVMDGKQTQWSENGQIESEEWHANGEVYKHIMYFENGQKRSEESYKDGEVNGTWTEWYENGQKRSEKSYKEGFSNKDGNWSAWYENGQKQSEVNWNNGTRGKSTQWSEDGQQVE